VDGKELCMVSQQHVLARVLDDGFDKESLPPGDKPTEAPLG
jgi:hypothetical protein